MTIVKITDECRELERAFKEARDALEKAEYALKATKVALQPFAVGALAEAPVGLPGESFGKRSWQVCKIVGISLSKPWGSDDTYETHYGVHRVLRDGKLARRRQSVVEVREVP